MSGKRSGIRWREDVGWELRCDECVMRGEGPYWPLTDEFWEKRWMTCCRACHLVNRRRRDKERYAADWSFRAKKAEEAKAYRVASRDVIRIKRREKRAVDALQSKLRYWANPERERQKARDYYWRNRDRIVEKRRERYHSAKDEAA